MSKEHKSFFWASYADLMTSLFFVMIVLFILAFVYLQKIGISPEEAAQQRREIDSLRMHNDSLVSYINRQDVVIDSISSKVDGLNSELQIKEDSLKASKAELDVIREIEAATSNLDSRYFVYDDKYKKHRLKLNVKFEYAKANIDKACYAELEQVGKILLDFIEKKPFENCPKIQYLLIIEGQASKDNSDTNYELSYQRALALVRLWQKMGIKFDKEKCEVLISGSGDGKIPGTDLMRNPIEENNQRFLIHIIPKPGVIK